MNTEMLNKYADRYASLNMEIVIALICDHLGINSWGSRMICPMELSDEECYPDSGVTEEYAWGQHGKTVGEVVALFADLVKKPLTIYVPGGIGWRGEFYVITNPVGGWAIKFNRWKPHNSTHIKEQGDT